MAGELLAAHIGAGVLGVLSGAAALLFRKGETLHRVTGTVFFLAMLSMCASALWLAVLKGQTPNILGAILTAYLVATAWVAAKRKDGEVGTFEIVAALVAAGVGIGTFLIGASLPPTATIQRSATAVFTGIMGVAAALDVSVVVRGGLTGRQRIARHLWRMCVATFNAVGSFAAQGAKVLPPEVQASKVLLVPMIAVVVVLLYWVVRVFFTNWYQAGPQGAGESS